MKIRQHKNAKTTPAIRKEIQESTLKVSALAKRFSLCDKTVRKWKNRTTTEDRSSRPHKLQTKLTTLQECMICFERKQFKKSMYDITDTLVTAIPNLNDMSVYRCLVRNDLDSFPADFIKEERKIRRFRHYAIGYVHIDFIYLPKINGKKYYTFTAIDRVSKIAFVWSYESYKMANAVDFLKRVIAFFPYAINYILTDNGLSFNYNSLPKAKQPKTKIHPFIQLCRENKIEVRQTKAYHPWTNGMVENFNKRLQYKVIKLEFFDTIEKLKEKIVAYVNKYNHDTKLRTIGRVTPAEYIRIKKKLTVQRIVT